MNQFQGKISKIQTSGQLSIVTVDMGKQLFFKSVIIDTPSSAPYLKENGTVSVLFKETEVVISTEVQPKISLQNQLEGILLELEKGDLLSRLRIDTVLGQVTAIISSQAVDELDLVKGSQLTAMIKLNEVILSPQT
ncbi:hypothetical protein GCM10028791_24850 [Echinicola sediminis]